MSMSNLIRGSIKCPEEKKKDPMPRSQPPPPPPPPEPPKDDDLYKTNLIKEWTTETRNTKDHSKPEYRRKDSSALMDRLYNRAQKPR